MSLLVGLFMCNCLGFKRLCCLRHIQCWMKPLKLAFFANFFIHVYSSYSQQQLSKFHLKPVLHCRLFYIILKFPPVVFFFTSNSKCLVLSSVFSYSNPDLKKFPFLQSPPPVLPQVVDFETWTKSHIEPFLHSALLNLFSWIILCVDKMA